MKIVQVIGGFLEWMIEITLRDIGATFRYTTRTGVSEFKPRACRLAAEAEKPFICISSLLLV
jgi:hypothetical protein